MTTDQGLWTIVARRPRGRFFRPVAGAPVGSWHDAVAAAQAMPHGELEVWYVPDQATQATRYVASEDRDNILTDNGRRVPIRWDAAPAASFPAPTRVIADELRVCSDCAQIIANGEINDGTDRGDQIAAAQVAVWGADAIGLVLGNLDDGPDPYSTAPCDGCGSILAGERWDAAVIR